MSCPQPVGRHRRGVTVVSGKVQISDQHISGDSGPTLATDSRPCALHCEPTPAQHASSCTRRTMMAKRVEKTATSTRSSRERDCVQRPHNGKGHLWMTRLIMGKESAQLVVRTASRSPNPPMDNGNEQTSVEMGSQSALNLIMLARHLHNPAVCRSAKLWTNSGHWHALLHNGAAEPKLTEYQEQQESSPTNSGVSSWSPTTGH